MSQPPSAPSSAAAGSEKSASDAPRSAAKPRSCVVCRSRKVRCDKLSPCSNCRRANIPCVLPSADRPPRWARRLDRANLAASNPAAQPSSQPPPAHESGAAAVQVMDRLQKLEGLVKDLSSQLEQAQAAVPATSGSPSANSTASSTRRERGDWGDSPPAQPGSAANKRSGQLVIQDAGRSRYISSDFWSKINDELTALRMDTTHLPGEDSESSEDEDMSPENSQPTDELQKTPSDRNAFIFGHNKNISSDVTADLHPLASQVSYLLDVFAENVNFMSQIVHMPSALKLAREMRSKGAISLTPSNEALLFAIYYAAVTSMEEDDVKANFGASKSDLNHRFRMGFETAVARADFLNSPNLTLVQAFTAFLCLARRHDSPRYVWMMVGIVIRMAQSIGLHRDGSHFPSLSPFEVEVRRRVWWALYMLDLRSSEDQGTDLTIANDSCDTNIPLNINDTDILPEMKELPKARIGITDTTYLYVSIEYTNTARKMMGLEFKHGLPDIDHLSRILNEMYEKVNQLCFQHVSQVGEVRSELGIAVTRLVMAKMKLLTFVPVLFSSSSSIPDYFSDDIRTTLFVAAIEVAEYNHSMNENTAFIPYRWIFQTYTHWHSIVYMLMEITRRPWSPLVERAWVALHSKWLIPLNAFKMDKNKEISMPLKKLLTRAQRHRIAELERLQTDMAASKSLEEEDIRSLAVPASTGSCPPGVNAAEAYRGLWHRTLAAADADHQKASPHADFHNDDPGGFTGNLTSPGALSSMGYDTRCVNNGDATAQSYIGPNAGTADGQVISDPNGSAAFVIAPSSVPVGQVSSGFSMNPTQGYDPQAFSPSWLWADIDPQTDVFGNSEGCLGDTGMDLDLNMNWSDWVQSAQHMERNAGPGT
ncbi:uncharacterized protein PG998_004719 [Apiospora kogelbergensis]|uniref:uncharacterized protein n=1 Tax=Apiospora kogelbergensis TaxID=1337665 RepID=UPI003131CAC1